MRTDRGYCCTDLGSEAIGIDFVLFIDFLVRYVIGPCLPIVIYDMKFFGDLSNDEIVSNPEFDQTVTSFICFALCSAPNDNVSMLRTFPLFWNALAIR